MAIVELKLAQQLAAMWQTPQLQIFLDLWKAYDVLDRGRCLEILWGYGVSPRVVGLPEAYCSRQDIIP